MRVAVWLLATLSFGFPAGAEVRGRLEAPSYSVASIVNSASNVSGALAPNTIVTIYGSGLAYTTRSLTSEDMRNGLLPTVLAGTGVQVLVASYPANVYFVSPTQVNILIPSNLRPGPAEVQLIVNGLAGPAVRVTLEAVAPALFQLDQTTAIATRADGSVCTRDAPAAPGEVVILYGTGLGQTVPNAPYGQIPRAAAPIQRIAELQILLSGIPVEPDNILYAGVTPGFAGLYQINLRLPGELPADPEIRLVLGDRSSPPSIRLPVKGREPLN